MKISVIFMFLIGSAMAEDQTCQAGDNSCVAAEDDTHLMQVRVQVNKHLHATNVEDSNRFLKLIEDHAYCWNQHPLDGVQNVHTLEECADAVQSTSECHGKRFMFTECVAASQGDCCVCATDDCSKVYEKGPSYKFKVYEITYVGMVKDHAYCWNQHPLDGIQNVYNLEECAYAVQSTSECHGNRFMFTECVAASQGDCCVCATDDCSKVYDGGASHKAKVYEITYVGMVKDHAYCWNQHPLDGVHNLEECAYAVQSTSECHGKRFMFTECVAASQGDCCVCATDDCSKVYEKGPSYGFKVYEITSA